MEAFIQRFHFRHPALQGMVRFMDNFMNPDLADDASDVSSKHFVQDDEVPADFQKADFQAGDN